MALVCTARLKCNRAAWGRSCWVKTFSSAHRPVRAKTLADVLALLDAAAHSAQHHSNGARLAATLVLVPTRELGVQVGDVFKGLAQRLPYGV